MITDTVRGITADAKTGKIWAANYDTSGSSQSASEGTVEILTPSTGTTVIARPGSKSNGPTGIAIDANSNAWLTLYAGGPTVTLYQMPAASTSSTVGTAATQFSPANITSVKSAPVSGTTIGGLNKGAYVAIDGAGNVFVANSGDGTVVEYNPTFQTATTGAFLSPYYGFSPSFTTSSIAIGGYSITSNVITIYAANTLAVGAAVTLSGFTGSDASLNGASLTVATASSSKFTANYTATATSGTVLSTGVGTVPTANQTTVNCVSTCAVTGGWIGSNMAVSVDRAGTVWTLSTNGTVVGIIGPGAPTDPLLSDGKYGVTP